MIYSPKRTHETDTFSFRYLMTATAAASLSNRTGKIWNKPTSVRSRLVTKVCRRFDADFGKRRLGNPRDPVDDLVFIIVSNKTAPIVATRTFAKLKQSYGSWDDLCNSSVGRLRSILKPAGLSKVKSVQLRTALQTIKKDFGTCDLRSLRRQPLDTVHKYLTSLPGVSDKVAKCVMMYTMSASVLPVDVHVHRIARRLGWTSRKRADQCHEELEGLIPPKWRYSFHVGCVLHGRTLCRPKQPTCMLCPFRSCCEYFRATKLHG